MKLSINLEKVPERLSGPDMTQEEWQQLSLFERLGISSEMEEEDCLRLIKESASFIECIENVTEEFILKAVAQNYYVLNYVENPSEDAQKEAVKQNGMRIEYIKNPSEEVQKEAVKQNCYAIQFIENPSEDVQIEALKRYGVLKEQYDLGDHWDSEEPPPISVIEFIEKPTAAVKLLAVKQDGYAIKYIKNPSEDLQKIAVAQNGLAIEYIDNPSEEVQKIAVGQDGDAIEFIENPSEEVQKIAVLEYCYAIRYIKNPSEEVQKIAVGQDGDAIQDIKNPSEEVQKIAVAQNGEAIKYIKNPSEEVQKIAVTQNGFAIKYIKNPSEEVQKVAVGQNGFAIKYIKNPSDDVQKVAVGQNGFAIKFIENPTNLIFLSAIEGMASLLQANGHNVENLLTICKCYGHKIFDYIVRSGHDGNPQVNYEKCDEIFGKARDFLSTEYGLPSFDILKNWNNEAAKFNEKEFETLMQAGIVREGSDYEETSHREWILKMYQVFGYDRALSLLSEIPLVESHYMSGLEDSAEFVGFNIASDNPELFTSEITLISQWADIINLFKDIQSCLPKGEAVKLFVKINDMLKNKTGNIEEYVPSEVMEEFKGIKDNFNNLKIDRTSYVIENAVQENVTHQQARCKKILIQILREMLSNGQEINEERLKQELKKELGRKNENGSYAYSAPIRNQEGNMMKAINIVASDEYFLPDINTSFTQMLRVVSKMLGSGWISKLIKMQTTYRGETAQKTNESFGNALEQFKYSHDFTDEEWNNFLSDNYGEFGFKQKLILKDKSKEGQKKALRILDKTGIQGVITFYKLEQMMGRIHAPFSRKFGEYFFEHKDEIFSNPEYIEAFSLMHNKFESLIKNPIIKPAYDGKWLDVELLYRVAIGKNFPYEKGEAELANLAMYAPNLSDKDWEYARKVFAKMIEREGTTIPQVKAVGKRYRGRMLRPDDPLALFVGNITGCCQRFGDEGEGAMLHSVLEKNGGVFVVEEIDENGKVVQVVGQSWVWRNDDVMCFDNIELLKNKTFSQEEQEEILKVYQEAAQKAVEIDEEELKKMLKAGKITEEQYEEYVLKEVRLGLGYASKNMTILEEKSTNGELEKSYDEVSPKEYGKSYPDMQVSSKWWKDSGSGVIIAKHRKLHRSDVKKREQKEVPILYRARREARELIGEQIDTDVVDALREMESVGFRKEQHIMQDCVTYTDVAYSQGCNPEELKVAISRDKDWYAIYFDKENSVYIADIVLINGVNAEKNEARSTESIISSIELAIKMYEVFIEAAKAGKTITCDATRDTSGLNIDGMVKNGLVKVVKDNAHNWGAGNIQMRDMELIPDKEKLEKELKKLEKMLEKAEKRRRTVEEER